MYITSYYKQEQARPTYVSYNNISTQTIEPTPMFKKVTSYVAEPCPRNRLTTVKQRQLITMEATLINHRIAGETFLEAYNNGTLNEYYYTFQIPKRSGGLRTINAPTDALKGYLKFFKELLEDTCKCLAHDSAYAYIKTRSTKDALQKHQANNSIFYLKIDLKDFFTNCTPDLVYEKLIDLYPFYYLCLALNLSSSYYRLYYRI